MTSPAWRLMPEYYEGSNIANDPVLHEIENDLRFGTVARWVRDSYDFSSTDVDETEQFWLDRGFTIERLSSRWSLPSRDAFERIMRLEFPAERAARIIASHHSLDIDYNLLLIHRSY